MITFVYFFQLSDLVTLARLTLNVHLITVTVKIKSVPVSLDSANTIITATEVNNTHVMREALSGKLVQ